MIMFLCLTYEYTLFYREKPSGFAAGFQWGRFWEGKKLGNGVFYAADAGLYIEFSSADIYIVFPVVKIYSRMKMLYMTVWAIKHRTSVNNFAYETAEINIEVKHLQRNIFIVLT